MTFTKEGVDQRVDTRSLRNLAITIEKKKLPRYHKFDFLEITPSPPGA